MESGVWRDLVVAEPPGFRPLTLDLFRPASTGPVPVVAWIHGGAWLFGSSKRDSPELVGARLEERILGAGFALARIGYRLSGEARFPAQLDDVRAAIRWLRAASGELGLDPERIAVWGESAGGQLAALAALTGAGDDAVRSAVIWYGPSNFLTMAAQSHPEDPDHDAADSPESLLIGGPVQQFAREAAAASPVTYASPAAPPMLLVHGGDDRIVPAEQSRELHGLLPNSRLHIVPGAGHCFIGADLEPLVTEALEFLAVSFR
ncbi:alpha/beta fold hydrolase [Dactylosporangium sp. CS-033363]|uniref:alpha/beta fold hydrolase n=1 Tax=Dactylosporangium sp. CS-033363 TaxID=3239935 RepID=UPI003D90499D